MSLLASVVPDMARRAVTVPIKRFGTVVETMSNGSVIAVLVDGDESTSMILNATDLIFPPGQRVVVDYYPPHGAIISGALTTTTTLGEVAYGINTVTTNVGADTKVLVATPLFTLYPNRKYLITAAWSGIQCSVASDTVLLTLRLGGPTATIIQEQILVMQAGNGGSNGGVVMRRLVMPYQADRVVSLCAGRYYGSGDFNFFGAGFAPIEIVVQDIGPFSASSGVPGDQPGT